MIQLHILRRSGGMLIIHLDLATDRDWGRLRGILECAADDCHIFIRPGD